MPTRKTIDYYTAELRRVEKSRQAGSEEKIRRIYKNISKDLNSFLANEYADFADGNGELSVAVLQEKARYAKFLQEVDEHLNNLTPEVSKEIQNVVKDTYKATYEGMIDAVNKSVDNADLKQRLKGLSLRPEVMNRAINNPISGLTLPDTLEKHRKEVIYNIKQQINIGLMTGERYDTMAKNIKKVLSGDNGSGGSYAKAMNIVRTETHRVQESGMLDCAKDISEGAKGSDLIYTATWCSMEDERVRPQRRIHTKKGWKTVIKGNANHMKMNGVTIKVGDKFDLGNGVKAECPGMSGTPENDCNCRCFLEYAFMTAEEFAKATGKSVAEVEKELAKGENKVENSAESDIIELYRKSDGKSNDKNAAYISDKRFNDLTVEAKKLGAEIIKNEPWFNERLKLNNASAESFGDVLVFGENVTVSDVLEETYHFKQNLNKLNDDKPDALRTILNEIDAKQYLIANAQKYSIPRNETELTKRQLEDYKKQLSKYKEKGEL